MSAPKSFFVIGATGYIGGSALVAIKNAHPELTYTALVRSPKDVAALEAMGVSVMLGSTENSELVAKAVESHDITFNAANADDLPLVHTIVAALKKRAASGTHVRPIYIHTRYVHCARPHIDG